MLVRAMAIAQVAGGGSYHAGVSHLGGEDSLPGPPAGSDRHRPGCAPAGSQSQAHSALSAVAKASALAAMAAADCGVRVIR